MFRRLIVALTIAVTLLSPSLIASAHTNYESVYPTSTGSTTYYQDFYVSAHKWHYIEQTYPDNTQCYHRIILRATGQILAGAWLWGNNHYADQHGATMGVYNDNSVSLAMRHSVSGCVGQVQVYNFHG